MFDSQEFVSNQLYDQDHEWLHSFINDLFNEDDFDFFKEVLKNEQKPQN